MGTVLVWYVLPYLQPLNSPAWVVGQVVTTVGLCVLIVRVFNNTGRSVLTAIVFHDMSNVSEFLYTNCGSVYDPAMTGIVTVLAVAIVVSLWRPGTLTRYRGPGSASASPATEGRSRPGE